MNTQAPVRRIVIIGCFPDDNRGSAALNDAACEITKCAFPAAEITLIGIGDSAVDRHAFRHSLAAHPAVQVLPQLLSTAARGPLQRPRRLLQALAWLTWPAGRFDHPAASAIAAADLVLLRGGYYVLSDARTVRRWLGRFVVLLPLWLARRGRSPVAALPSSVIAPASRLGDWALKRVLARIDHLAVRDGRAANVARRLGRNQVECYSDTVFFLRPPTAVEIESVAARFGTARRRYAVLTARSKDIDADEHRPRAQACAVRRLFELSQVDEVLVLAQTVGPELDDSGAARALVARLGPRARLVEGDYSHRDLLALYARAEIVLSQHLHSLIFSVMGGTPALVWSVDGAKAEGLLRTLGLPDWLVLDRHADEALIAARIDRILADPGAIRERLRRATAAGRVQIDRYIADLQALVPTAVPARSSPVPD